MIYKSALLLPAIVTLCLSLVVSPTSSAPADWTAELDLGVWTTGSEVGSSVSSTGVDCSYSGNGLSGGLMLGHRMSDNTLLTLSVVGLNVGNDVNVNTCTVSARTSVVSRIHLGAQYYLPGFKDDFQPYMALSAGPVVAYESRTLAGMSVVVESRSETAFGVRGGVGFDVPVSRIVRVGLGVGMNLMTDFQTPINGRQNYSGGDAHLRVGVSFGGAS